MRQIMVVLLFLNVTACLPITAQVASTFMGRKITVVTPGGSSRETPAKLCLEGLPTRQCYTAPDAFFNNPKATVVQLKKGVPAILFSAETHGTSGWRIHFELLRPGIGNDLDHYFMSQVELSNSSQHEFWTDSSISDLAIFLTADFVWGPNESHYSEHRFMISAFVTKTDSILDGGPFYFLEDRYMTVRKYDREKKQDVLAAEKQEILARLRRLRQR